MDNISDYRNILNKVLANRKIMNPMYSMRSFARDLQMSPSSLSRVLNRKEGVSIEAAKKMVNVLDLSERQKKWFVSSVGACHARNLEKKQYYQYQLEELEKTRESLSEFQLKFFDVIKQWYHFAILELTHLEQFQSCVDWISKTLKVCKSDCELAIKNLQDLKLLECKDGNYIDKFVYVNTPSDIPSISLKMFHSDLIKKANCALVEQPVDNREIISSIMAIDKKKLPEFKTKLRKLKREFEIDVEKDKDPKSAVYCLNMNFYELSH